MTTPRMFTDIALSGYNCSGTKSPYLATSNNDMAWQCGAWLKRTGRAPPHDVRPGRGYDFHVNGMLVTFKLGEVIRIK